MENTTIISPERIEEFRRWLRAEERSEGTIEKYVRDVTKLELWLGDRAISKESVSNWKEHLLSENYAPVTINSMLASVNTYCRFMGLDCKVKFLRIQKKLFRDKDRELSKHEYEKLIETSEKQGKNRLALLIETIGATGIRVSEVQYITVEAAQDGKVQISLKGKIRCILLPSKLCRKLIKYAKKNGITTGAVFITKTGKVLSRKLIWAEMKAICKKAGVLASKVFPHNLRHLFARIYYRTTRDVAKLADLLGHSSIETTRIYLLSTGEEHARQLEMLGLVR